MSFADNASRASLSAARHAADALAGLFDILVQHSEDRGGNENLERVGGILLREFNLTVATTSDVRALKSKIVHDHKASVKTILYDQSLTSIHDEIRALIADHLPAVKKAEADAQENQHLDNVFEEFINSAIFST